MGGLQKGAGGAPLDRRYALRGGAPSKTSIPNNPADGDQFRYAADASTDWVFRYDAVTGYWKFAGGPPLVAEVDTQETTTGTSYAALATAGPSITLPFEGDYLIQFGCASDNNTATVQSWMSFKIGAGSAADADGVVTDGLGTSIILASVARARKKTGVSAGDAVVSQYRTTAGGTAAFLNRYLNITPIRVH